MVFLNNKKMDFKEEEIEETSEKKVTALFVALMISFGIALSSMVAYALRVGYFMEYKVPLLLLDFPFALVFRISCFFFIAVLSGISIQMSVVPAEGDVKSVRLRSQKISYFFSILATLCFTMYACAVLLYFLNTGVFLSESIFLAFLYLCILFFHFKAGKSALAHSFTTSCFVLVILITSFYAGIASAKIENKNVVSLNGEVFALAAVQDDSLILVGFNTGSNKANGKIMLLSKDSPLLEKSVFFPFHQ